MTTITVPYPCFIVVLEPWQITSLVDLIIAYRTRVVAELSVLYAYECEVEYFCNEEWKYLLLILTTTDSLENSSL